MIDRLNQVDLEERRIELEARRLQELIADFEQTEAERRLQDIPDSDLWVSRVFFHLNHGRPADNQPLDDHFEDQGDQAGLDQPEGIEPGAQTRNHLVW